MAKNTYGATIEITHKNGNRDYVDKLIIAKDKTIALKKLKKSLKDKYKKKEVRYKLLRVV